VVVRDDDVLSEEGLGFADLVVVLAEAYLRSLFPRGELQVIVLRSDLKLLACSQITLPDGVRVPPMGSLLPVFTPEFKQCFKQ
jgi:hypothetical protein